MPHLFEFAARADLRGPAVWPGIGFPLALFGFLDDPVGRVLALQRLGRDVVPLADRNPAIVCIFGHERARRRAGRGRVRRPARRTAPGGRIATMEPSKRMAIGVDQAHALLCRLLRAAGAAAEELEDAQRRAHEFSAPIVVRHFGRNLRRDPTELPFFARLARYVDGAQPRLSTPFEDRVSR